MGDRLYFEVQEYGKCVATLFANCSHRTCRPELAVERAMHSQTIGVTSMLEKLLSARYQTSDGNNAANDRMFQVRPGTEGLEHDALYTLNWGGDGKWTQTLKLVNPDHIPY